MPLFPDNAAADHAFFYPYSHDFKLLVKRKDLPSAKCQDYGPPFVPVYWPPLGWESIEIPRDDSENAIRQWFDLYLLPVGALRCRERLDAENRKAVDCSRCVRDAWRLVTHFNALGRSKVEVRERSGRYDAHEALIELEGIRSAFFPTSMPQLDDASITESSPLSFSSGAFLYCGHREKLRGKPLQVLEAFARAKDRTLTLVSLRDQCWGGEAEKDTIRSTVKTVRAALRRAIKAAGGSCDFDPLQNVDQGEGRTAWRLELP